MKNIVKIAMSVILAFGCAYIAKSQACPGDGTNTINFKETSSALGGNNNVYGKASTAIGAGNTVSVVGSKNNAFAMGNNNNATAKLSFAFGDQNTVSQIYSFAFGQKNTVSDGYSFAIGTDNKVNANTSIALGYYLKNTKSNSVTIGIGKNPNIPLVNNTDGIVIGMYSNIPTLFISKSADAGKTGKVGIGNVTGPIAKLHIMADSYSYGGGEDADILLEPTSSDTKAALYFKNTDYFISMSANNGIMKFRADNFVFNNGNVAIGNNSNPSAKLHVFGKKGEDANIFLQPAENAMNAEILFRTTSNKISVSSDNTMSFAAGGFSFNTNQKMNFSASSYSFADGKVGIGCENNIEGFALAVKGGVVSTQMSVLAVDLWPDFVFSKDYARMNLHELEEYIEQNHHLPEVPSAEEVSANGINLGEMDAILLQKIEELTLHVIELQKQIDELKAR